MSVSRNFVHIRHAIPIGVLLRAFDDFTNFHTCLRECGLFSTAATLCAGAPQENNLSMPF
jgi:hypothetical protein